MRFVWFILGFLLMPHKMVAALAAPATPKLAPAARISTPRATPLATSPVKKGEHLKVNLLASPHLAIKGGSLPHDPKTFPKNAGPTEFQLTGTPANSKPGLILRYVSKDPRLQLNTNKTIVVQFLPDIHYTITPNIITNSQWPKNSTAVSLNITGPFLKNGVLIRGKASYFYCSNGGKNCKRAFSNITYFYRQP